MANQTDAAPPVLGQAALAGIAAYSSMADGTAPGLHFYELAHIGKLNLRGGASLENAVRQTTGCNFPPAANRFSSAGERHAIWLGPDEFLLLCEAGKETQIETDLNRVIGDGAAVTDVTDSLCALALEGTAVRQTLAKGCALDLHESAFTTGMSAQTMMALAAVTLLACANDRFIIICRTSFAPYLRDWLCDAGLEFGVSFKN